MDRRTHTALGLLLAIAVIPLAANGFETLDGTKAKWRSATVNYSQDSNSPDVDLAAQRNAIDSAFSAWSDISNINLSFNRTSRGQITVDFDQNWPREWGQEAAGITITNRNRNRISSAEIHFNNQYFEWSTSGAAGLTDIQGVATHEIGHAIGFGHSFYFESTMYWTGGDVQLRSLGADDLRGARFLYGASSGAGQMCDTCLEDSDCSAGAYCIGYNSGKTNCGQACTRDQDCPEHAFCYQFDGGARSCVPNAYVCSDDDPTADVEAGEYCFGASHCTQGSQCISLDTTAECVQSCTPPNGNCPNGGDCYPTGNADTPGLCIPPGSVPEGGICGSFQNRCQTGLECAYIGDRPRCFSYCEPGGQCQAGFGCSPLSEERWVCLSLNGPGQGEPCDNGLCGGGLTCLGVGGGQQLCAPGCLPDAENQCNGGVCLNLRPGVGACSPGTANDGDSCDRNLDCTGGYCLLRPSGKVCTRPCQSDNDCAANFECQALVSGEQLCIPANGQEPVTVVDSDVASPQPRDQSTTPPPAGDAGIPPQGGNPSTGQGGATGQPGPPVLFFDDEPAEPGCACSTDNNPTRSLPLFLLLFLFALNGLGARHVRRTGGEL